HLRRGAPVDHDTVSRASQGVLKQYQDQDRLEADVRLESSLYNPATKTVDYRFVANRGPVVKVDVQGASIDADRVKHLIPIYEEGSVDEDLLNEGNRRLRDYFQRQGYFDVKVDHSVAPQGNDRLTIQYAVQLGTRRRLEKVSLEGNHYFDTGTLTDILSVHAANLFDGHGLFSQALVSADVAALQGVYQNNGFSQVTVKPETSTPEALEVDATPAAPGTAPESDGSAPLTVTYRIVEGPQIRVAALEITGNQHIPAATLLPLLNTAPGQILSPRNLAGDRDTLVTEYYSRGFDHANVTVTQQPNLKEPGNVDVFFHVDEGKQVFVRDVLLTGLNATRPQTVAQSITVHAGDPLNPGALADTQR